VLAASATALAVKQPAAVAQRPTATPTDLPTSTSAPSTTNTATPSEVVSLAIAATASPQAVAQLPSTNSSQPAVVAPISQPAGDSILRRLHDNGLLVLVEGLIFVTAGLILLNRISARRRAAQRQLEQRQQVLTLRTMIAQQIKQGYQSPTVAQNSTGAERAITRQAARLISTGEKQRAAVLVSTIIQNNPNNAEAWYLFSFVADDLKMRIEALERALYINPGHDRALDRLAKLRPGDDLQDLLDITW